MSHSQSSSTKPRCPSSLEDLRRQAHDQLDQILDSILTPGQRLTFLEFEKHLLVQLAPLGQLLLQIFLLVGNQRLDLTAWLADGRYCIADPDADRKLHTVYGDVRYQRAYLRPTKGRGPGVHPLDAELGLTRDSYTPCTRPAEHVIDGAGRLAFRPQPGRNVHACDFFGTSRSSS